jgi:hypothetical protein
MTPTVALAYTLAVAKLDTNSQLRRYMQFWLWDQWEVLMGHPGDSQCICWPSTDFPLLQYLETTTTNCSISAIWVTVSTYAGCQRISRGWVMKGLSNGISMPDRQKAMTFIVGFVVVSII